MSIVETDTGAADRSLPDRPSNLSPVALAAIARFGTAGAAIVGGLIWVALALFGL